MCSLQKDLWNLNTFMNRKVREESPLLPQTGIAWNFCSFCQELENLWLLKGHRLLVFIFESFFGSDRKPWWKDSMVTYALTASTEDMKCLPKFRLRLIKIAAKSLPLPPLCTHKIDIYWGLSRFTNTGLRWSIVQGRHNLLSSEYLVNFDTLKILLTSQLLNPGWG